MPRPSSSSGPTGGPDPGSIHTAADLVAGLDTLRRRAARGTGRARISLNELAERTDIPRSTVHVYLTGRRSPTPDALDAILQALGVHGAELGRWAEALERTERPVSAVSTLDATVPQQLPLAPRGLVGRAEEQQRLDDLLLGPTDDPGPRILALSGAGGIGKTALVAAWAQRRLEHFPDGQLWLDLHGFGPRPPLTATAALGRLLRAIGQAPSPLPADVEVRAELLRTALAGRRLLLVLDNAADTAQLRPLLPGSARCTVVVTSRGELRTLAAETGAVRLRLRPLTEASSLELLGAQVPADSARRLAARCAGSPLALRIVRERLLGRSPAEAGRLADELDDRPTRLGALELSEGEVEIGVRPVLAASYRALTEEQARLFRLLPLCLGGDISVAAAAAAVDRPPARTRQLLDALTAASLLEPTELDRYGMDDLVATFADEQAIDRAESAAARTRLLSHLLRWVDAACRQVLPTFQPELATDLTDAEFTDLADASQWLNDDADLIVSLARRALDQDEPVLVWPLLNRAIMVLLYRRDLTPFTSVLASAVAAAQRRGRLREEALMWRAVGITAGVGGDFAAADTAFGRMAMLARRLEDRGLLAIAIGNLVSAALLDGRNREGIALQQQLNQATETPSGTRLRVINSMTSAWCQLGELDEAWSSVQAGVAIAQDPDSAPTSAAIAYFNRAWVMLERGEPPAEVLPHIGRGWAAMPYGADDNSTLIGATIELDALLRLERFADAEALLARIRPIAERSLHPEATETFIAQGRLLVATGDVEAGLAAYRHAVALAGRMKLPYKRALAGLWLARGLAEAGVVDEARATASATRALAESCEFALIRQGCSSLLTALG